MAQQENDSSFLNWLVGTVQSVGNAAAADYINDNFVDQPGPAAGSNDGIDNSNDLSVQLKAQENKLILLGVAGILASILAFSVLSR